MTTAEFMELITTLRELDHHKRNLVKAAQNQQTDATKILELIEVRFELESAGPIVRVLRCPVTVPPVACNAMLAKTATKPSMH
jgi:hypothetical protein